MVKIFHDQNSQRITSRINAHTGNAPKKPVFSRDFSCNALIPKLPNTYIRGL